MAASNSALANFFAQRPDAELSMRAAGTAIAGGATDTSTTIDLAGGTPYSTSSGAVICPLKMAAVVFDFSDVNTPSTGTLTMTLQLSNASDFGSGNVTVWTRVLNSADDDSHPRRLVVPFINQDNGNNYRYVRFQIVSANSATATYGAFMAPAEG